MPPSIERRLPDEPRLTRMPHISAPVDDHLLVPNPPRSLWDRMLVRVGLVAAGLALLGYFFIHASALR